MASSSSFPKHVFFLITLLLLIDVTRSSKATESQRDTFFKKIKVDIFNDLEGGSILTLHCKSKDDDLGFHTLQSGQSYQFTFRPRFIFGDTLFFCGFAWPDDPSLHYFVVYHERYNDCIYCPWRVHKQNICGPRDPVPNDDPYIGCYPYNKSLEEEAPPAGV
ncbi:hypothetical protein L6164_001545 [Bauhinia variegata]|uniref:Uncharacterized protein n=1 Tax=Bauhinia variegata TaxID=167791 RepID=A0ACB9Q9V4_BAUVA|nr:hypothetical protein L6164_001545 [Bauhinia variegata]